MSALGGTLWTITIPDGQWWRIVYLRALFLTGVETDSRLPNFDIESPPGSAIFSIPANATQGATTRSSCLWAPGVSNFSIFVTASPTSSLNCVVAIPDLIWATGSVITVGLGGAHSDDSSTKSPNLAVEIFTESDTGQLVPEPTLASPIIV